MATMSEAEGEADGAAAAPASARDVERKDQVLVEPIEETASIASIGGWVEGFEALYVTEYQPMLRIAFLLVDSADLAEEVVHDAFARVGERWAKLANPGGYLRTCVVNRCRDVQRRRRTERRTPLPPPDHSTELGADELADALAALPIKRRAAIVLRYYDGLSEARIAEVLGVKPGTVKSLLSRGLAELREVIEP
jgi:RNA polymerase sigma-70 factor (sigma-E family)